MDSRPPGFSAHGILQARILEWVAIAFSDLYADDTQMYVSTSDLSLISRFMSNFLLDILTWISDRELKLYMFEIGL